MHEWHKHYYLDTLDMQAHHSLNAALENDVAKAHITAQLCLFCLNSLSTHVL